MNLIKDFKLFAQDKNISSLSLENYLKKNNLPFPNITDSYINPTILEERQLNVSQMDVFSRLMMDRIIFLGTEINDFTANVVNAQLLYLNSTDAESDISIYINSPGGSVYDGLGIYDTMQYISCDVSTVCTSLAASMASIILCAGTKGKRYAQPHARIMVHQPMGGTGYAQASDIEIVNNEIQELKKELFTLLSNHTGQDYNELVKLGDRDCWIKADKALEMGMIDNIITKKH